MSTVSAELPRPSFGQTMRPDLWWRQPLLIFLGLSTFIVYSTWAAFQGSHYFFGNYISPFYSPEIFGDSPHSWFGPKPDWWPGWLLFSPALLILWAPGGFRLTCYYYRGAYYKAFWADPPACTVGEPRKTYLGERSFPLIIDRKSTRQNSSHLVISYAVFCLIRTSLHSPSFPTRRSSDLVVAGLVVVFARSADSQGAGRIPAHLLLLSRRVLQSILGGSTRLYRRRAA